MPTQNANHNNNDNNNNSSNYNNLSCTVPRSLTDVMPHEYSSDSRTRDTSGPKHCLSVVGHLPMPASVAAMTASCCTFISTAHAWKKKRAMSVGSFTRGG